MPKKKLGDFSFFPMSKITGNPQKIPEGFLFFFSVILETRWNTLMNEYACYEFYIRFLSRPN